MVCRFLNIRMVQSYPQVMSYPPFPRDAKPIVHADPDQERDHRKQQTALGYRLFAALRWGQAGDGHISARDPEQTDCFWLLRYGVPFNQATVNDLVLVGPDGSVVEGEGDINETAYFIHMPIHEARPEATCVAHTHTSFGTPWSAMVQPFQPLTQEAVSFVFNQSIFNGEEVNVADYDTGRRIATAVGASGLCFLRNHGMLTVGATVAETVGFFVMAERVAEVHIKAPEGLPISDEVAKRLAPSLEDPTVGCHAFEFLCRTLVPDRSVVD